MTTILIHDLIEQLQVIETAYGGELPVVTDSEASVIGVEYNDSEGAPAVVLAVDLD